MPLDYRSVYPVDDVERALPDLEAAALLLGEPALLLAQRVTRACQRVGITREAVLQAASLATLRLACRHGGLGTDFHAYHNENHVLELLELKLPALLAQAPLSTEDCEALALFCAGHDLRQREVRLHSDDLVGANEAASLAEFLRLLAHAGLGGEPGLARATRYAIVGSTFATGTDENTLGAFAHRLSAWLDETAPGWRDDPNATRAEHLARIAADLDTSNVASPYPDFAESAIALATEIQYRSGRSLASVEAGESCAGFLTAGQERYVFSLQRFASREGRLAFGALRDTNAARVRKHGRALRESFEGHMGSGEEVIARFRALAR